MTGVLQEDGFIEYFNTIVVQPHKKLVTNQGRGYHVRCRYQTKDTAIISGFNVRYHHLKKKKKETQLYQLTRGGVKLNKRDQQIQGLWLVPVGWMYNTPRL